MKKEIFLFWLICNSIFDNFFHTLCIFNIYYT